jgi:stage IV sporulation protein FB
MRIATIAGCDIRANWLFVAVMLAAAVTGWLTVYLVAFALVLLHEVCHALVAHAFGFAAREIELLPFGGVAKIDGMFEMNPTAEFFIALAGPACNLLLLMVAVSLNTLIKLPEKPYTLFVDTNLGIAALNLLPALPLDGGRMMRGLLARHFDVVRVTRGCALAGVIASALLACVFLWAAFHGVMNLSLLLMAVFLCFSAWKEYAQAPYLIYRGLTGKKGCLKRKSALPVRELAARGDMRLGRLARRFSPGYYHIVTVLDDDCRRLGTLDEERAVEALMDGLSEETLERVLRSAR